MKKHIVIWTALALVFAALAFAGFRSAESKKIYCEIVLTKKGFSQDETLVVNYGGKETALLYGDLEEEMGTREKRFSSALDALNFMCGKGWELESAFAQPGGVTVYVLERSAP